MTIHLGKFEDLDIYLDNRIIINHFGKNYQRTCSTLFTELAYIYKYHEQKLILESNYWLLGYYCSVESINSYNGLDFFNFIFENDHIQSVLVLKDILDD